MGMRCEYCQPKSFSIMFRGNFSHHDENNVFVESPQVLQLVKLISMLICNLTRNFLVKDKGKMSQLFLKKGMFRLYSDSECSWNSRLSTS